MKTFIYIKNTETGVIALGCFASLQVAFDFVFDADGIHKSSFIELWDGSWRYAESDAVHHIYERDVLEKSPYR